MIVILNNLIDNDNFKNYKMSEKDKLYREKLIERRIHIGDRLKKLLSQEGVKQADLARKLGLSPQSLNVSLGKGSMNTDTWQDILNALDISPERFFDVEDESLRVQLEELKKRMEKIEEKLGI